MLHPDPNLTRHAERSTDASSKSKRASKNSDRMESLRSVSKEGFDAIEQGNYTALSSDEEISAFLQEIHEDIAPK